MSVVSRRVRDAVHERDGGVCRRCFNAITADYSIHHRKLRSRGGDDSMANLVLLCGSGTTGCHGWIHAHVKLAELTGWIVPSWREPQSVPVIYPNGGALFLSESGWERA